MEDARSISETCKRRFFYTCSCVNVWTVEGWIPWRNVRPAVKQSGVYSSRVSACNPRGINRTFKEDNAWPAVYPAFIRIQVGESPDKCTDNQVCLAGGSALCCPLLSVLIYLCRDSTEWLIFVDQRWRLIKAVHCYSCYQSLREAGQWFHEEIYPWHI